MIVLTTLEKQILEEMPQTSEYCVSYRWFGSLGDKKTLQPAIKHLKELGLIEFHRGLMSEEGEVAGSGWCWKESRANEIEELLYPNKDTLIEEPKVLCHACQKPIHIDDCGCIVGKNRKTYFFHSNIVCLIEGVQEGIIDTENAQNDN